MSNRNACPNRWTKTVRDEHGNKQKVRSARHGKGSRWPARYVGDPGRERAKEFVRKGDAQRWLDNVVTAGVTGTYVDPQLGKITFESFYRERSSRIRHRSARRSATVSLRGLGEIRTQG
jgi:hypothetical protein